MFGENEKKFVESLVNHLSNVAKVQDYLKENFNVLSYYDEDNETLHLVGNGINEGLDLAAAKEYVNQQIDEAMLSVVYGGVDFEEE
jgi:thioredoxin-related protein